jgi:hypothetical protein
VYEPVDNITFSAWCDTWLNGLRSSSASVGVLEFVDLGDK